METPNKRTVKWSVGLIECFLAVVLMVAVYRWWGGFVRDVPLNEGASITNKVDQKIQTIDLQVDINLVDMTTLSALPGLGPVMAKRIIDNRDNQGRFDQPSDLIRVKGIGEKKLNQIRPWIFCGPKVALPSAVLIEPQTFSHSMGE